MPTIQHTPVQLGPPQDDLILLVEKKLKITIKHTWLTAHTIQGYAKFSSIRLSSTTGLRRTKLSPLALLILRTLKKSSGMRINYMQNCGSFRRRWKSSAGNGRRSQALKRGSKNRRKVFGLASRKKSGRSWRRLKLPQSNKKNPSDEIYTDNFSWRARIKASATGWGK